MEPKKPKTTSFFLERFKQAKLEACEFINPLDEHTFRRKPSSGTWCIGECFSHLVETGRLYYTKIEQGMEHAEPSDIKPKEPMQLRFHMQWFVNYMKPPVSFKSKSPKAFQPVEYADLNKETALNNYLELQDRFIKQLKKAEDYNINLNEIKVPNPVIPLIKMRVSECIAVTEAHQRRHLEQAKNTLELVTNTT